MNPTTPKGQRELKELREKYQDQLNAPQPGSLAWYDANDIEAPIVPPVVATRMTQQDALEILSGALEHQSDVRPYDPTAMIVLMEAADKIRLALVWGRI